MRPLVVFLVAHAKSYRIPFWNQLHNALAEDGIDLRVVYGCPNSEHRARRDNVSLPDEYGRKVPSYWLGERIVMHAAWEQLAGADLVITQNENKLLINPLLLATRPGGTRRIAFWGKGNIHPAALASPGEWLRFKTAFAVDWWFPYTKGTAANLRMHGVRCGITAVDNSIDTSELKREIASFNGECILAGRRSLGMGSGPIGVFCGNLSPNKELEFLFEAAHLIHEAIPEFSLLVIGNGPLREYVERRAVQCRYIRFMGPRVGREKALLLRMSDVFLLPGAVGLAILDSFAAGLPFLTTQHVAHGPEISYLQEGVNGLTSARRVPDFAALVTNTLGDSTLLTRLREGALASASEYSIENMVKNFREGIHACLGRCSVPRTSAPESSWTAVQEDGGGQS